MCLDDAIDFAGQGFAVRQVGLVAADEKFVGDAFQCVLNGQAVFLCSEHDAKGLVVAFRADFVLEIIEVEVPSPATIFSRT